MIFSRFGKRLLVLVKNINEIAKKIIGCSKKNQYSFGFLLIALSLLT